MSTSLRPGRALLAGAGALAVLAAAFAPASREPALTPLVAWDSRFSDRVPVDARGGDAGWSSLTLPAHPPSSDARFLLLRTTLPATTAADPVVAFDAVLAPFEARVDGKLALRFPADDGLATTWPPGFCWPLVPVPGDGKPHELLLVVRAAGNHAVVRGTPFLAARAGALAWAVTRDVPRLACGFAVVVIGLLGALLAGRREDARAAAGYAVATAGLGLYVVIYTHLKDLLFDAPHFWFALWLVVVPLQALGSLVYIDELFGSGRGSPPRRRSPLHVATLVQAGYTAALFVAHAVALALYPHHEHAAVVLFGAGTNGLRLLILVNSLVAVAAVGRKAVAGDVDARIWVAGFLVLTAFAVLDVAAGLGAASLSWKSHVHFGAVAMTVAFAVLLARRHTGALERIALLAREKEWLLRDLHDGVGSLTSNVRMLAELGRRPNADTDRTLAAIAELSATALGELRSFVQALDDTTMTWEALFAELRRFAATVVEAAGATFTMSCALDAPEGAPPGLLVLNLVRLFRESLTNALKQAGVTHIDVVVTLSHDRLEVRIENDGGGEKRAAGVDAGRGLRNLRARAAALGGALDVEQGDKTRLVLSVPLPLKTPMSTPGAAGAQG